MVEFGIHTSFKNSCAKALEGSSPSLGITLRGNMQTFKRICIKDFAITDDENNTFSMKRGEEYITSAVSASPSIGPEPVKDHVIVFSNYWVPVSIEYFSGHQEFTKS